MITLESYLMGRDKTYDCPEEVKRNAAELLEKVNRLLAMMPSEYGEVIVTSGWRPAELNATVKGAAPKSHHILGNAVDIADPDRLLGAWCKLHLEELEECGLFIESPDITTSWVHFQSIAPKSGKRIFIP